jgi:CDP-diacylglycerol--serine O-phosphatidyltransferase
MAAWSKVSLGDLFTLANGVLGFVAITFILDKDFLGAMNLIFLSMMMDGLDGYMARRFGSKHTRGQVLDSISDSISFAFAPALLLYAEFHTPGDSVKSIVSLLCAIAFLAAGLFRLARFSVGGYQLSYFVGMPAPAGALVIVLICMLFGAMPQADGAHRYYFIALSSPALVLSFGLLVSFLMASEIPYPKIRGKMAAASGFALLLAVTPAIAGLLLVGDQPLYTAFSRTATSIALALSLVYVFGGPLYERQERTESG